MKFASDYAHFLKDSDAFNNKKILYKAIAPSKAMPTLQEEKKQVRL